MLLDIDELDDRCSGLVAHKSHNLLDQGSSIKYETLLEMKALLLGSSKKDFQNEWKIQNFSLKTNANICYGIIQQKGGPCGVLACVQAYLLQELYFGVKPFTKETSEECTRCLAIAISHILWICGNKIKAVVVFPNQRKKNDHWPAKYDGFNEKLGLFNFHNFNDLEEFITSQIVWYMRNDYAVISFLYSVLLSRGLGQIKMDMDDSKVAVIGMHGYCSQEIINLLLTGEANSNVFDGIKTLNETLTLRGIRHRSDIGFLTLMEYHQICQVGQHFKCPKFPIWIICSESHFTVLFSKEQIHPNIDPDNICAPFNLFYYDGLNGQEDEIYLTLSTIENYFDNDITRLHSINLIANSAIKFEEDLIRPTPTPLENCIRTKYFNMIYSNKLDEDWDIQ